MSESPIRQPAAIVPIAMSLVALSLVVGHFAVYGTVREPDEGTAAHLYQLLMAAQLPIIAWFAAKWLPRAPARALGVLGLQFLAALAALAALFVLERQ